MSGSQVVYRQEAKAHRFIYSHLGITQYWEMHGWVGLLNLG